MTWEANYQAEGKKSRGNTYIIRRKYKREKPVKYEVTDKPPPKKSGDWARVVAVVVSGAKWQFKEFPFRGADEGDLVDTFNRVRGFYAKYDVDLQLDIIKTWNVKTLSFQKNVRHADRAQVEVFWNELDKHLTLQRSKLKW